MIPASLQNGITIIKSYVKTLPDRPGVYRMLDARQNVLYVGKALSLKNRVSNYTQFNNLTVKLQRMIAETTAMEFVVTRSEVEALLLEANLIKQYDPPYNVRLKDDKFFAYIHLSAHPYPRLTKYRGDKSEKGQFFGPFISAGAIDQSLTMLYKTFKIRSCTDGYFAGRTRPCLQYHIKRCSAPCTAYISPEDYNHSVQQVIQFLKGKTHRVQQDLSEQMYQASDAKQYEKAAALRDQIKALRTLQAQQSINIPNLKDADFFALARQGKHVCIQGFFYRNGSNYGTHSFFVRQGDDQENAAILTAFLLQFYTDKTPPKHIFLNEVCEDEALVTQALSQRRVQSAETSSGSVSRQGVSLTIPQRGERQKIMASVQQNALEALERDLQTKRAEKAYLESLATTLNLEKIPERIEVYDNSHIQGSQAIGAMIVAGPSGLEKRAYRKFTIKSTDLSPGDDFGMMKEVLKRRFSGSLATSNEKANRLPDLIIIDGGKGQLSAAQAILDELDINLPLLAIAKGPDRNAGKETFFTAMAPNGFKLEQQKSLLYYLQRLRDEAHRFAITFHRDKRTKGLKKSLLDRIPGVGPARKKALLQHFGSAMAVKAAGIEDLEQVAGLNKNLAELIYKHLHTR
jgi:Excinuclease ABC subunit C